MSARGQFFMSADIQIELRIMAKTQRMAFSKWRHWMTRWPGKTHGMVTTLGGRSMGVSYWRGGWASRSRGVELS